MLLCAAASTDKQVGWVLPFPIKMQSNLPDKAAPRTTYGEDEEDSIGGKDDRPDQETDERKGRIVEEPSDIDVLLGRGKPYQSHPGNKRMLQLVKSHKHKYSKLKREFRHAFAESVLDKVYKGGARFLRKEGNHWIAVNREVAFEKIAHALRNKRPADLPFPNRHDERVLGLQPSSQPTSASVTSAPLVQDDRGPSVNALLPQSVQSINQQAIAGLSTLPPMTASLLAGRSLPPNQLALRPELQRQEALISAVSNRLGSALLARDLLQQAANNNLNQTTASALATGHPPHALPVASSPPNANTMLSSGVGSLPQTTIYDHLICQRIAAEEMAVRNAAMIRNQQAQEQLSNLLLLPQLASASAGASQEGAAARLFPSGASGTSTPAPATGNTEEFKRPPRKKSKRERDSS